MTRRLIALAVAGCAAALTGCLGDSLRPSPVVSGKVVGTPQLSPASSEVAERVSFVGSDLLAATPLGIPEIEFFTVTSSEPELFHREASAVFVSEGLADRCRTDDELAAVLAHEVGRLTAEFRRAARKQVQDPIPAVASAPKLDGSTDYDPSRDIYLAQFERSRQAPADKKDWPTVDPREIAAELLRNAGRDPKLLAEVAPLVKVADGNSAAGRHLGGGSAAPKWTW